MLTIADVNSPKQSGFWIQLMSLDDSIPDISRREDETGETLPLISAIGGFEIGAIASEELRSVDRVEQRPLVMEQIVLDEIRLQREC